MATQGASYYMISGSNLIIGACTNYGGVGYTDYFNGDIDDLRIYNRALNTTEITSLYIEPNPLAPPPPPSSIPTLSQWGLIFLGLLLMVVGTFFIMRRRRPEISL